MKRSHVHGLFAALALTCAAAAAHQFLDLQQARNVNAAIAEANTGALRDDLPEARFALAASRAKADQYTEAVAAYKSSLQESRADLRRAALFNLGNLHLREALRAGPDDPARSLPLIELAKQSYRDLLREDPSDWHARYNLERALWLAPDTDDVTLDETDVPMFRRRVVLPAPRLKLELP